MSPSTSRKPLCLSRSALPLPVACIQILLLLRILTSSPTLPRRRYAFAGLKASHVTEDLKEAETLLEQLRAAENNAS